MVNFNFRLRAAPAPHTEISHHTELRTHKQHHNNQQDHHFHPLTPARRPQQQSQRLPAPHTSYPQTTALVDLFPSILLSSCSGRRVESSVDTRFILFLRLQTLVRPSARPQPPTNRLTLTPQTDTTFESFPFRHLTFFPTLSSLLRRQREVSASDTLARFPEADQIATVLRDVGRPHSNRSLVVREAVRWLGDALRSKSTDEVFRFFVERQRSRAQRSVRPPSAARSPFDDINRLPS